MSPVFYWKTEPFILAHDNIYVTGGNYGTGDLIADLGGHWQDIDGATNIEVPDVQHGDVAGMMNYISENGYSNVWGILHVCEWSFHLYFCNVFM